MIKSVLLALLSLLSGSLDPVPEVAAMTYNEII